MAETTRLIRYDELDQLLELYEQLHPGENLRDNPTLRYSWDEILKDPGLFYIVHEAGGKIVASCTLAVIKNLTRNLRPYGLIENVITRADCRKKGYGTKVLHKAIDICRERNCYKVMLLTGSKSESTLRFYENAGFAKDVKTGYIIDLR